MTLGLMSFAVDSVPVLSFAGTLSFGFVTIRVCISSLTRASTHSSTHSSIHTNTSFHTQVQINLYVIINLLTLIIVNNNLISQAALMQRHGVPNDILSNLNPFALLIFIAVNDRFIYPALRKAGIRFTPIKKITAGFFTGAAAMIWAAIVQHYIYQKSDCGMYASGEDCPEAPINVWAQTGAYVLIALSEVFASITSLEYAFSKAPKNMRSMVQAVALFMTAFSAALGQALVGLAADPLLVWNYAVVAILAVIAGTCFWFQFKDLDIHEDDLNALPEGHAGATVDEESPYGNKRIDE
jgi:POT family proton-dependent oligopeptide transporter